MTVVASAAFGNELHSGATSVSQRLASSGGLVRGTNHRANKAEKDDHLEYLRTPLRVVIEGVNRYSDKPIVLADESVGNLLFSGTVFEGQVTDWLRALAITFPVVVLEGDDRIVICIHKPSEVAHVQPE
jgi:ferric-dicitrate binding protein FerR (iron transport regulator)